MDLTGQKSRVSAGQRSFPEALRDNPFPCLSQTREAACLAGHAASFFHLLLLPSSPSSIFKASSEELSPSQSTSLQPCFHHHISSSDLFHPSLPLKNSCAYISPSWIIQHTLPILRSADLATLTPLEYEFPFAI